MSSNADLNYQRWQYIRAVENVQTLEQENLALRKKIESMQKDNVKGAGTFAANIAKFLQTTKTDLQDTKSELMSETYGLQSEMTAVKEYLLKLRVITMKDSELMESLKNENQVLKDSHSFLNTQVKAMTEEHVGKDEKILEQFNEAQEQLERSRRNEEALMKYTDELRIELEEIKTERDKLKIDSEDMRSSHMTSLHTLRAELRDFQNQHVEQISAIMEEHSLATTVKDNELDSLRAENAQLISKLDDQDDYIKKLTTMLMGNKSNFAKFVELKTENAELQNELQRTRTKSSKGTNNLIPTSNTNNQRMPLGIRQQRVKQQQQGPRGLYTSPGMMGLNKGSKSDDQYDAPTMISMDPYPPLSAPRLGYHDNNNTGGDNSIMNDTPGDTPLHTDRDISPRSNGTAETSERILQGYADSLFMPSQNAPPLPQNLSLETNSTTKTSGLGVGRVQLTSKRR